MNYFQVSPSDEKSLSNTQNIVLRHLYLLLGYNISEKSFHVAPQILRYYIFFEYYLLQSRCLLYKFIFRCSAVFNAFLSNLAQLLDQNYKMGVMMLPTTLLLLQYCPCSPHSVVTDFQNQPTYSLWNLEPHIRRCWIMSVFVFLYKVKIIKKISRNTFFFNYLMKQFVTWYFFI